MILMNAIWRVLAEHRADRQMFKSIDRLLKNQRQRVASDFTVEAAVVSSAVIIACAVLFVRWWLCV